MLAKVFRERRTAGADDGGVARLRFRLVMNVVGGEFEMDGAKLLEPMEACVVGVLHGGVGACGLAGKGS